MPRTQKHTPEFVAKVLARWNAGSSALQIGNKYGVTKNVIVGIVKKARASGIKVRTEINKKGQRKPAKLLKAIMPTNDIKIMVTESTDRWVRLFDLGDKTCRYTQDGSTFCNAPANGTYCPEHSARLLRPVDSR